MHMTIYADMVFLINFIMDSFILWIVSITGRKKVKPPWILLGGLIMSALYCLLIFTAAFRYMNLYAASVLILSLGIAVALRPRHIKQFVKMLLTAYAIAFTVGGLGMALYYLTDLPYAVYYLTSDPASFMRGLSWKLPAACIAASYGLIRLGLFAVEHITVKRQVLCPVRVFWGDDDICFDALLDTGHSLCEPITHAPVIVAEFEKIKTFLPDGVKLLFYENHESDLQNLLDSQGNDGARFYNRLRMIPFTSLGRANGMLIGFRPDRVAISLRRKETTRDDVVIGIYNHKLTRDGRYQGLLGPEAAAETV